MNKYNEALSYFIALLNFFPYHHDAHLYIAKSYYVLKRYNDALRSAETSIAISETDIAYYNCGLIHEALGNDSLAFEMYKNAYTINDKFVSNLFSMSKVYYRNNMLDKSLLLVENILDIENKNYGYLGKEHKIYIKFLINLYLEKNTDLYNEKSAALVYKLCVIDPKDHESLEMYEKINREIFRVKDPGVIDG